tara:strand:- start:699 stop:1424 length:726 start_codon:yes stop_codon:yes gene_type:complete
MPNSIRKRLRLHQDWTNDIPLKNIWGINFSARIGSGGMDNVGDAVNYYLDIYRPNTFKVDTGLIDRVSDSEIGFMLAQNIAFPGAESFNVSTASLPDGIGGFQPGQVGGDRSTDNNLSITFLETNRDVFSFFLQPWVVAASYAGLIEDDTEPDIKCNIDIIQYTRTAERYADKVNESNKGNNDTVEYGIRKMHTFYDAVPVSVEGGAISYGAMSESDITRGAAFNFSHYQLNTPRGVLNGI